MKYNFSRNNKIFINENLTRANEYIAFCGRKLKRNSKINSCFTWDGVVFIKKTEKSKAFKFHHMNVLYDAFWEFDFFNNDGSELYHDVSPNVSGQSSYWSDQLNLLCFSIIRYMSQETLHSKKNQIIWIISRYICFSALAVVLNSNILVLINKHSSVWALLASNFS